MATRQQSKKRKLDLTEKDIEKFPINFDNIEELYSWLLSITSIMENGQKFIRLLQQSKSTDSNKKLQELQLMKDLDLSEEEQLEIQSIIAERNRLEQQLELKSKQKACFYMQEIIKKIKEHEDVISPGMMEILNLNQLFAVVEADLKLKKHKKHKTSH